MCYTPRFLRVCYPPRAWVLSAPHDDLHVLSAVHACAIRLAFCACAIRLARGCCPPHMITCTCCPPCTRVLSASLSARVLSFNNDTISRVLSFNNNTISKHTYVIENDGLFYPARHTAVRDAIDDASTKRRLLKAPSAPRLL